MSGQVVWIPRACSHFQGFAFSQLSCLAQLLLTLPVPSCAPGDAAGALPFILGNRNVAGKCHETNPPQLFLDLPSFPPLALTAVFVVAVASN